MRRQIIAVDKKKYLGIRCSFGKLKSNLLYGNLDKKMLCEFEKKTEELRACIRTRIKDIEHAKFV